MFPILHLSTCAKFRPDRLCDSRCRFNFAPWGIENCKGFGTQPSREKSVQLTLDPTGSFVQALLWAIHTCPIGFLFFPRVDFDEKFPITIKANLVSFLTRLDIENSRIVLIDGFSNPELW